MRHEIDKWSLFLLQKCLNFNFGYKSPLSLSELKLSLHTDTEFQRGRHEVRQQIKDWMESIHITNTNEDNETATFAVKRIDDSDQTILTSVGQDHGLMWRRYSNMECETVEFENDGWLYGR